MTSSPDRTAGRESAAQQFFERLRTFEFRNEAIALIVLVVGIQLFPRDVPLGLYVLGATGAAGLLLHAIAIVLVYRANKFINFAQLQLGVTAGILFTALVQGQFLLNVTRGICMCVSAEPGPIPRGINYVLAAAISIGAAALVAFLAHYTLLRRFTRAPRIMLTLVTIFAGQALAGTQSTIQGWLIPSAEDQPEAYQRILERSTRPPGDFRWQIDAFAQLRLGDILLVVTAFLTVIGLALYLRRSDTGVAIRAAAESPDRAQTLGVDVAAVAGRVWIIAGLLAGIAGVVSSFGGQIQQDPNQITIPVDQLAIILAIAVVARFSSLGMAAAAAAVLGVVRVGVQYAFASTVPLDAMFVFLIGGLLLLQRARSSRAEREEAPPEVTKEVRPIPKELRHLPQVQTWVRTGAGIGLFVLLGLPWVLSVSATTLVAVFLIYSIVGLSLLVLTGWAGQISLGQFGFATIGAWAAAVSGLPLPFALVLGGIFGALAAVIVGVPALKLRGMNLAISTLAFAVSARALFMGERFLGRFLPDQIERPNIFGMDFDDARTFYYFSALMVALCCIAVIGLRRSRTGRVLIAIRSNEATGQSFGINLLRAKLTAFAVSGFLAAFAGAVFAFHQRQVTPESFVAEESLDMFMFTVIGGLGGIAGPLLGFTYMAMLSILSANPIIQYTASGTGAILLLMAAPGGLAQVVYDARDSALRRLAVRLRIPVPSLMGDRKALQLFEKAPLDQKRGRALRYDGSASLTYKMPQQWALDRYGDADAPKERVGD